MHQCTLDNATCKIEKWCDCRDRRQTLTTRAAIAGLPCAAVSMLSALLARHVGAAVASAVDTLFVAVLDSIFTSVSDCVCEEEEMLENLYLLYAHYASACIHLNASRTLRGVSYIGALCCACAHAPGK